MLTTINCHNNIPIIMVVPKELSKLAKFVGANARWYCTIHRVDDQIHMSDGYIPRETYPIVLVALDINIQ